MGVPTDVATTDYYRHLLRNPPDATEQGAHLVWVRLISHVLASVEQRAPNFALALCCEYKDLSRFVLYCGDGYEQKYLDAVPHAFSFVKHFLASDEAGWLKDLVRCEIWLNRNQFTTKVEQQLKWRDLLGVKSRGDFDYVLVTHDVTVTIQEIVGYRETTMSRVGNLLWLLGVPPIRLLQRIDTKPGIAIFSGANGRESLRFMPADE